MTKNGLVSGPLWAWGEWEAEADVVRKLDGIGGRPRTLFEPYWERKASFENLHNTDPFVFGGFYYTDCKQGTSASLTGLVELGVGSVIIFGSLIDKCWWVLDTVLVVGDHIDHDVSNFQKRLHNRVPTGYDHVVLGPTYEASSKGRLLPRRLYIGATFSEPLDGMFSFFPCSAPGKDSGFARPELRLSSVLTAEDFTPSLAQGAKGHGRSAAPLSKSQVKALWSEVRDQVLAAGCDLGVWVDMPQRRG